MERKFIWKDISPTCLELQPAEAWLTKPLHKNKFLLVSWRMSGSEFTKSLILENFNSLTNTQQWGKSHSIIDSTTAEALKAAGTKIIVVITDPREVAANLLFFDNGLHYYSSDYKIPRERSINSVEFLNSVAKKQVELIKFFSSMFQENCIVVRYEDALFFQEKILSKLSKFFNLIPSNIDGVGKYRDSKYKNVGHFHNFFSKSVSEKHYKLYKTFYEKWDYPFEGLAQLRYKWCVGEIS